MRQGTEAVFLPGRATRLWLSFIFIQFAAIVAAAVFHSLVRPAVDVGLAGFLLIQSAVAVMSSWQLRQPRWWQVINAVFMPLVVATLYLEVNPAIYLMAFVFLWATYGRTDRNGVPLFLSGKATIEALSGVLRNRHPDFVLLDIGSGTGSVLRGLRKMFPAARLRGVELALVPWGLSRILSATDRKASIARQDMWDVSLHDVDVVYAFLSPVPMKDLWEKVCREMKPGSLFISNTFEVPGVQPDEIVPVPNRIGSRLLVWRIPG